MNMDYSSLSSLMFNFLLNLVALRSHCRLRSALPSHFTLFSVGPSPSTDANSRLIF